MTAGADAASAPVRPALRERGVFAAVLGNGFEFFDFTVMKFLIANPSATTLVLAITILSLLHAAASPSSLR